MTMHVIVHQVGLERTVMLISTSVVQILVNMENVL